MTFRQLSSRRIALKRAGGANVLRPTLDIEFLAGGIVSGKGDKPVDKQSWQHMMSGCLPSSRVVAVAD